MAKVRSIMRGKVITVDFSMSISGAARVMSNNRIGSVVIAKDGEPAGIMTREDIVKAAAHGKDLKNTKVSELKRKKFITASPDDDLKTVVQIMVENGVSRVPVIDKGKLVGILTEKEILVADPKMADLLAEKMKYRIAEVSDETETISGVCENCGDFSNDLRHSEGRWHCETCRNEEGEISEEEEF